MRLYELPQLPAMDSNDVAVYTEHDANAAVLLTATGTMINEKHIFCIFQAKCVIRNILSCMQKYLFYISLI